MTTQTAYFPLAGGLDLATPPLRMPPGTLIDAINYECHPEGGYKRLQGYERFNGKPKPSEASYWLLYFDTGTAEMSAGNTVTGGTSAATGEVLDVAVESGSWIGGDAAGYLVLFNVDGDFVDSENILVGGATKAVTVNVAVARGFDNDTDDITWHRAAIEATREDITAVPGSGPVRGVWWYNGFLYAFRNSTDGLSCKFYKATTAGWSEIAISPALAPDGNFEFCNYNFGGHSGSLKMYWCDGKNKAYQYDGTTVTAITTGMTVDKPVKILANKQHLTLVFSGGSLQSSSTNDPLTWSPVSGASEIATGVDITGIKVVPGEVTIVFSTDRTDVLSGYSQATWSMSPYSLTSGAVEKSIQTMPWPVYVNERGVTSLRATDTFADMRDSSISEKIDRLMERKRGLVTASLVCREKGQYRLFFSDDTGLYVSFVNGKPVGIMPVDLGLTVTCAVSAEDSDGREIMFIGADDGMVYQMDAGTSFDGAAVTGYIRTAFSHQGAPEVKKRYRKAVLELTTGASPTSTIRVTPDFSYSSSDSPSSLATEVEVTAGGDSWDSPTATYDSNVYYDAQFVGSAFAYLFGGGTNISLLISTSAIYEEPHIIHGIILHYEMRRRKR